MQCQNNPSIFWDIFGLKQPFFAKLQRDIYLSIKYPTPRTSNYSTTSAYLYVMYKIQLTFLKHVIANEM